MSDNQDLTVPPNREAFNEQVWRWVRQVPAGQVATYGQIANLIPAPAGISAQDYKVYGSRWVGSAMAASPAGLPWQRVINAQGKISQRPGAGRQRQLLENEGVVFVKDKIDLTIYQWRDPSQKDEPRQARLL